MKPDLCRGPDQVANDLVLIHLQSRRCGKSFALAVHRAAASGRAMETELAELRQRLRRANFIAENGLSGSEALHIPLDFDPAAEAGNP